MTKPLTLPPMSSSTGPTSRIRFIPADNNDPALRIREGDIIQISMRYDRKHFSRLPLPSSKYCDCYNSHPNSLFCVKEWTHEIKWSYDEGFQTASICVTNSPLEIQFASLVLNSEMKKINKGKKDLIFRLIFQIQR